MSVRRAQRPQSCSYEPASQYDQWRPFCLGYKLASHDDRNFECKMSRAERRPLYYNWAPKYWPSWLGIGLLRLLCLLPFRWQIGLGKSIGRLAHRIGAERRAIARRNIELCFPELSAEQRKRRAREHGEALVHISAPILTVATRRSTSAA